MPTFKGELARLARTYGIQTAYAGNTGRVHASVDVLQSVLGVLGVSISNLEQARDASREHHAERNRRLVEPVIVSWDGLGLRVPIRTPGPTEESAIDAVLFLEDGTILSGVSSIDARSIDFDGPLPLGYHRLVVEAAGRSAEAHVIAAPTRAFEHEERPAGPEWGLFAPLYGLRRADDWGCGDFRDLDELVDWTSRLGGRAVGTLPLCASFLDEPFDPSPYSPVSRLFWNELFVDPADCPEWESASDVRVMTTSAAYQQTRAALSASPFVDYRAVMHSKRRVLEQLARVCDERLPSRRSSLDRYIEANPRLVEYARFRARVEKTRTTWPQWPHRQRHGGLTAADCEPESLRYHAFVQWLADAQLHRVTRRASESGCGLYLDLPLGSHHAGFDVWRDQALFATEASVGAPPDRIFATGQDWGFPPIRPDVSRQQGHRYWTDSIRKLLGVSSLLRIDHVMGLHRLYWIPEGMERRDGVYVRYPADELYAILSLESHRNRCAVVGENLGIVPQFVNRALSRHGIRKTFVFQYSLGGETDRPVMPPAPGSVASMNTHDTPTFASFWQGSDLDESVALGLIDDTLAAQERTSRSAQRAALVHYLNSLGAAVRQDECSRILDRCLAWLLTGKSRLVVVTLEDLWGETRPQNKPGSPSSARNWRRKLAHPLEEIFRREDWRERLRRLHSGR